jgi:ABC-type Fe3+ transport system substrate-binding protein
MNDMHVGAKGSPGPRRVTSACRAYFSVRLGVIWLVLFLPWLTGCRDAKSNITTLVIISPHREEIRDEVETAFARWLQEQGSWRGTQVQLEWRDLGGGTGQILRYLREQYRSTPEGVGIDILYGGGTDIYYDLKDQKLLERYSLPDSLRAKLQPELRGVRLYDPDGYWYGVMLSSLGILHNRDVLERIEFPRDWAPSSWKDLGDERLFGWVSAGDPRMSGSVHMLYEMILQKYGWEEGFGQLMRIGANARNFARFSDSVSRDVVLGKVAMGGTLDSYAFSALTREDRAVRQGQADRNPLGFVLPPGETILNPDSMGILKGAPHLELARAFVEFNLSEEGGQRLWMLQPKTLPGSPERYNICRLSIMKNLYNPEKYPPAQRSVQLDPFDPQELESLVTYDNDQASERWNVLNDLFGSWIVDPHAELKEAWQAVMACPPAQKQRLMDRLFAPPCGEEEVQVFSQQLKTTRVRAETVRRWFEEARQRYRQVRADAETGG